MLEKLERKLGRFAIPNLIVFLIGGQVGSWVLSKTPSGGAFLEALSLHVPSVLRGEVWRLVSFLFVVPAGPGMSFLGDFFLLFYFLLMFLYGRALEAEWGEFKFNAYVFIGWLATVASAFLVGQGTNLYLMQSLFFAFAYLNPNFELRLFFILPVKIKWLALLAAAQMVYAGYVYVAAGAWTLVLVIVAGVVNFALFFTGDVVRRLRGGARRRSHRRKVARAEKEPTHRCAVCGKTDLDDPEMQFRYCSRCDGGRGYCMDHIRDHEHVRE